MSFFALSCFVTAILTVVLATFVFKEDPRRKLNQTWFLTSLAIVLWTLGLGGVVMSENQVNALIWQRVLYIGTILLPIFYFNFCATLLEKSGEMIKRVQRAAYFFSSIFIILLLTTNLFIGKITTRIEFGYWPVETGPLYWVFLMYFILYIGGGLILLLKNRKDQNGITLKHVNYVYYASLIVFIGGSPNFLLDFNLNIYPFGNYFVVFYVLYITYAIVNYQLFNIKVVATEIFVTILLLLISTRLLFAVSIQDMIVEGLILVGTVVFGIFLIRSVKHEIENREKGERLARYLANANARLRELDKQKTEFVSIASHQLRSPIAAIKGYASLMSDGSYGTVPDSLREPLRRILESGHRIGIMVDDFLNITRIEQGRMTYNMVSQNVCKLLQTVINELKVVAEEKGLELTMVCNNEKEYLVKADEGKLKQIFSNLLDNAIKYTQEGSIRVEVTTLDPEHKVLIQVKDTGIGIAPEEISNLFQKFNRASNANEVNVLSTGLGLYIAREIMKAHEGWINVESEGVGKGSTFTVELPVCDEYVKQVAQEKTSQ